MGKIFTGYQHICPKEKIASRGEEISLSILAVLKVLVALTLEGSLKNQPESELNQPGFVPLLPYSPVSGASHSGLINSELCAVEEIEKLCLELNGECFRDSGIFTHRKVNIVDAMGSQLWIGTALVAEAVGVSRLNKTARIEPPIQPVLSPPSSSLTQPETLLGRITPTP